jgi:hypothetical protein
MGWLILEIHHTFKLSLSLGGPAGIYTYLVNQLFGLFLKPALVLKSTSMHVDW